MFRSRSSDGGPLDPGPASDSLSVMRRDRPLRLMLLALWLVTAAALAFCHVMWRDEVRALSLALQGDTVVAMLKGIQGEGHPALWYLLLRGAHTLFPTPLVLPLVAFAVAASAMVLVTLRSPFPPLLFFLLLFSGFGLYEYAVMARNYGISMPLLFLLADRYPRHRDRGVLLGVLLALLCNTNVHSVGLAAGFLLFWLVEILLEQGIAWTPALRSWLINAAIAAVGVVACALVVYPPFNDAAVAPAPAGSAIHAVLHAITHPGGRFWMLAPAVLPDTGATHTLLTIVIVGSIVGLVRWPGAFLAALFAAITFLLLFTFVYPGGYRHQALMLVFLAALYWLALNGRGGTWPAAFALPPRVEQAAVRVGGGLFLLLMAFQLPAAIFKIGNMLNGIPESRSRDFGRLLARPDLRDAIVIASPDYLAEPIGYYAPNPVYFVREHRFGRVAAFTRAARTDVTLDDILGASQMLRAKTGRPVVIALRDAIESAAPAHRIDDGYYGTLTFRPDQVRAFLRATRRVAALGPAVTNEHYVVYLLAAASPSPSAIAR